MQTYQGEFLKRYGQKKEKGQWILAMNYSKGKGKS